MMLLLPNVRRRAVCLLALLPLAWACQPDTSPQQQGADLAADSTARDAQTVAQILYSLPSPQQGAQLLKQSGARFEQGLPNPDSRVSRYATTAQAALNIGIYSADLAYLAAFDQNQQALKYFGAIQKLGDQLGISGAFDQSVLDRLDRFRDNPDSVQAIVARAFEQADRNLRRNNQEEIARMVVVGGWVEGVYLANEIYRLKPNPELGQRIAEQKVVLSNLMELLGQYPVSDGFRPYHESLQRVQQAFDAITVDYTSGEVTRDTARKTIRVDNANEVRFTAEQLARVREAVAQLRTQITA